MYCPAQTTVAAYTLVRRERRLPVRGELLVELQDRVDPGQVIVRGARHTEIRLIDVARALGVSDAQVGDYLRKEVGETVEAGEAIAVKKGPIGLLSKTCRSTLAGRIVAISRGRVLLEAAPVPVERTAYLRGHVAELLPDYGAVIEAQAGLIEAVWGLGGEATGIIKVLVASPDEPLTASAIDIGSQGYILVGGASVDVPALLRAAEVKVKGIVVGGIHASLAKLAPKLPFPVVVTEGLGHIPMAGVIFDLLRANEGEEASLSGQMDDHGEPIRPEVVIFSAARHDVIPAANDSQLKEGVTVRIVREPYIGKVGTVKALPPNVRVVDSGLALLGAEVELHSGEAIFVPINNLELIR